MTIGYDYWQNNMTVQNFEDFLQVKSVYHEIILMLQAWFLLLDMHVHFLLVKEIT